MKTAYTDQQLNDVFHQLNPHIRDSLTKNQLQIIRAILRGRDTLSILPTGEGKSACFQVAAMLLPGITVVIEPLISLIQDQVETLSKNGIPVACLSFKYMYDKNGPHYYDKSDEDKDSSYPSRRRIRDGIFADAVRGQETGKGGYKFIYVTPERLRRWQFIRFARKVNISLLAIDEAHCISLWGYDFRKRYLEISGFYKRSDNRPIVAAFTATATKIVKNDIVEYLRLKNPKLLPTENTGQIRMRDNLFFSVIHVSDDDSRMEIIRDYVKAHRDVSGFIYCTTVQEVKDYYENFLEDVEIGDLVTRYYAELDVDLAEEMRGLSKKEPEESKSGNWHDFLTGKKKVIICTNALGMGVNKPDIQYVLHVGMPQSLENYYQEAGRAGRDKKKIPHAECRLFFVSTDHSRCTEMIRKTLNESGLYGDQRRLRKEISLARFRLMNEYCNSFKNAGEVSSHELQAAIVDYFNQGILHLNNFSKDEIERIEEEFTREVDRIDMLNVNRTKIAQMIRNGIMQGKDIRVSARIPRSKEKDPSVPGRGAGVQTVSYEVTGGTLSYLDMMVADAVYTLMNHRHDVTARSVMQLLSGDMNIMLQPDRTKMINDSIRKMTRIRISIDISGCKEMCFMYDDEKKLSVLEGPFLPLFETSGGFKWQDGDVPPLYYFAELMNGQFHTFPLSLLKVGILKIDEIDRIKEEIAEITGRIKQARRNLGEKKEEAKPYRAEIRRLKMILAEERKKIKPVINEIKALNDQKKPFLLEQEKLRGQIKAKREEKKNEAADKQALSEEIKELRERIKNIEEHDIAPIKKEAEKLKKKKQKKIEALKRKFLKTVPKIEAEECRLEPIANAINGLKDGIKYDQDTIYIRYEEISDLRKQKKKVYATTELIAMTHYLLCRIDSMRIRRGKMTSTIKEETMAETLEEFFRLEYCRKHDRKTYSRKVKDFKEKELLILDHLKGEDVFYRYEQNITSRKTKKVIPGSIRICSFPR